jgi:hypothetical protein
MRTVLTATIRFSIEFFSRSSFSRDRFVGLEVRAQRRSERQTRSQWETARFLCVNASWKEERKGYLNM